ncbi:MULTISPECIES: hypothetical protein [Bacillus]|jgi:hypothetical protein|uniref:Uncharacterized protein n=1 Tax=Bacillus smithii 7_3_47FAA TaxID=665952 RepID=G9QMC1_9BACI|nr:hypothetical protein [Bacillus smithii]AKP46706.1 hypothetical protein BSM4216_1425 [Bacillus smithii]EHL77166.1 hypothetical protein HMPREF1015_00688 [Bacillus smithii 7_3_47FAA]MED4883625.1 hypothetical protein [Bacillus smithii]MED4927933.1 hypothetical protein [Bacillus smithii]
MKHLVNDSKKKKTQEKLAVIRMELDYELAVLFEAMEQNDKEKMDNVKTKLHALREELVRLESLL